MIKVLKKAFDILETIATAATQPKNLSEIADKLELNQPTTARILKTLTDCGYAEQIAPKKGYILGPMAYSLARFGPYRKDLSLTAESDMAKLAESVRETVIITAIHQSKRYTLNMISGNQDIQVSNDVVYDENIYQTATGRLLMAYLPKRELESLTRKSGLPGEAWPEADSLEKLESTLSKIRKDGKVTIERGKEIVGIAYPLFEGEVAVAALGIFMPGFRFTGEHKENILNEMAKTAAEISNKLTHALADK